MIAIIDVIRLYEKYYPEVIDKITILNSKGQHSFPFLCLPLSENVFIFCKATFTTLPCLFFISAPIYIKALFEPLIHAAITRSTLDSVKLKLLGNDRNEWRRYLLQTIDEKQLPEEAGGLRERN